METTMHVDLSAAVTAVLPIIGAVLLALLSWLSKKAIDWFEADAGRINQVQDAMIRRYVETGLQNAVAFAMRQLQVGSEQLKDVEIKNKVVAQAAQYASDHVQEGLDHFDLTPESVAKLVTARLPTTDAMPGPTMLFNTNVTT